MKEKFGLNINGESSVIGNQRQCFEGKAPEKGGDFPNHFTLI